MQSKKIKPSQEDIIRKKFARFSTQTFKNILSDREVAIKYTKIGLIKTGNINPTQKLIEEHASIMQSVARIILNKRMAKNKKESNKEKN